MVSKDTADIVARVRLQAPQITSESLHFILEGLRAEEGDDVSSQIHDVSALLARVRLLRNTLAETVASDDEAGEDRELLQLDRTLAQTERDLVTAVRRVTVARGSDAVSIDHTGK